MTRPGQAVHRSVPAQSASMNYFDISINQKIFSPCGPRTKQWATWHHDHHVVGDTFDVHGISVASRMGLVGAANERASRS